MKNSLYMTAVVMGLKIVLVSRAADEGVPAECRRAAADADLTCQRRLWAEDDAIWLKEFQLLRQSGQRGSLQNINADIKLTAPEAEIVLGKDPGYESRAQSPNGGSADITFEDVPVPHLEALKMLLVTRFSRYEQREEFAEQIRFAEHLATVRLLPKWSEAHMAHILDAKRYCRQQITYHFHAAYAQAVSADAFAAAELSGARHKFVVLDELNEMHRLQDNAYRAREEMG